MKNRLFVLMITLLILCGCKGGGLPRYDIQEYFTGLTGFTFTGMLRTDYGDRVIDFGLDGVQTGEALTLTLTSPDVLRGLKAKVSGDGSAALEYEGLVLETGSLPGTGLSPLETVPMIFDLFRKGYIDYRGLETFKGEECLRVTFSHTENSKVMEVSAWFSLPDMRPLQAEVSAEGALVARLGFDTFSAC